MSSFPEFLPFVEDQVAKQQARGFAAYESETSGIFSKQYEKAANWGITNITTYNWGDLLLKNVVSYRRVHFDHIEDIDGMPNFLAFGFLNIAVLDTRNNVFMSAWSEEFQVQGSAFDDAVDWIAGCLLLHEQGHRRQPLRLVPGAAVQRQQGRA